MHAKSTSKLHSAGDMVAIMEVLVRPPSESCNILVNLLSLLVQELGMVLVLLQGQLLHTILERLNARVLLLKPLLSGTCNLPRGL